MPPLTHILVYFIISLVVAFTGMGAVVAVALAWKKWKEKSDRPR